MALNIKQLTVTAVSIGLRCCFGWATKEVLPFPRSLFRIAERGRLPRFAVAFRVSKQVLANGGDTATYSPTVSPVTKRSGIGIQNSVFVPGVMY